LRPFIEAIHSIVARSELRHRVERLGAAQAREALALGTQVRHLRLTSMAWDAVETADLDELAFLIGATCFDTMRLETCQAVRAVLENRALRQLVGGARAENSPATPRPGRDSDVHSATR
jgi:hypothetical protein